MGSNEFSVLIASNEKIHEKLDRHYEAQMHANKEFDRRILVLEEIEKRRERPCESLKQHLESHKETRRTWLGVIVRTVPYIVASVFSSAMTYILARMSDQP